MNVPRKHEIPSIPPEFIIRLPQAKNKEFITANGLIYLGHLQGLKRVDVQIVHAPTKDDASAIVRCEVETDLGTFSDYGEVSPINKGTVGGTYPLSMATTRARNRALRIATGCPLTSYEEMGMEPREEDDDIPTRPVARADSRPLQVVPATPAADGKLQRAHDNILEWVQAYHAVSGELVAMPDGMNLAQATKYLRDLQTRTTDVDAALKQEYKRLQSGRENLKKLTGEDVPVPEKLTLPEAEALLAKLKTSYRAATEAKIAQSAGAAQ
jgi:hypothetical protein